MKATYKLLVVLAWATMASFVVTNVGCVTETTYHADGSKSVIKSPAPGSIEAFTAAAIAFAPKARVVAQKSGAGDNLQQALENAPQDPKTARITPEEIEARAK